MRQTAKAAHDLHEISKSGLVGDQLIKMGFSYEEWQDLLLVLNELSSKIAITLTNARTAKETVRRLVNETADFGYQVNQLWWREFGGQVGTLIRGKDEAQRQAQQRSMIKTKVKYGSLEGFDPLRIWNSDQLGMWYAYRTRESEILFQLNELIKGGSPGQGALDRKVALETELADVRQKMLEMRRGTGPREP